MWFPLKRGYHGGGIQRAVSLLAAATKDVTEGEEFPVAAEPECERLAAG
ncbi:MAG: hypothetical protein HYV60_10000 [Planctomycetia bacterium]|nr:hypothetical protein [Planctomycetia bacterium]